LYKIPAITLFMGKSMKFVPECSSTNDLMQLICQKEQLSEGAIVITSNQTAGRGQRGNTWDTEPGRNLTFSLYLKPIFLPIQRQFFLNIFVSLGISDFLTKETGKKVQIKWPNDILLEEKKISGVLIENQIVGQMLASTVVGIGLNVNQQFFSIPTASSLLISMGIESDLQNTLESLLHCLESRYLQLKPGKYSDLRHEYLNKLFRINELHSFTDSHGTFNGTITGIDEIGRLQIRTNGEERSFDIKEIKFAGW
jgi:BirA family transcriptional regulator, biotin operon repressor / biotin---[acetyl-CoA-carboxylase] ligase